MEIYTPTNLRKNLFDLLNRVADKDEKMEVTLKQPTGPNKGVVLISKERYAQLEELDFLQRTGTLDVVMNRMENEKPDDFDEAKGLY
jgi:PHD/YefM family antitoxin component YafN of YafNO toxin-antitoxin module